MRKVSLYMITTPDGFIARPNGDLDFYEPSAEEMAYANGLFGGVDAILFGRVVYQGFVDYWDTLDVNDTTIAEHDRNFATLFRTKPRVVFSTTLETTDPLALVITKDLAAEVNRLKAQPGNDMLLICGPDLVATLLAEGVIDEILLLVPPVLLGQGVALFGKVTGQLNLRLLSAQVFESGSVLHQYTLPAS